MQISKENADLFKKYKKISRNWRTNTNLCLPLLTKFNKKIMVGLGKRQNLQFVCTKRAYLKKQIISKYNNIT